MIDGVVRTDPGDSQRRQADAARSRPELPRHSLDKECYADGVVRSFVLLRIALLVSSVSLTGCLVVRPHQRENLARRAMTVDRDSGEARFGQHQTGAREGADGGTGQPGGGCGCN